MASRRVIIDTDTAGDDAFALLTAVLSERLSVEGVTVVAGNVEFDRGSRTRSTRWTSRTWPTRSRFTRAPGRRS
jgi:inosine-uridine nucleoside N-ribohydrolase